ncbi:MAG: M15 family metallopeptidase, partial [Acidimicrobiia bacterium]|nr:M15 family metallopeptidase [Acidimicrobiia bacterium]
EQALRELEEMSLEYQDLLIGSEERLDLLLSERQTLAELNETVGSELSKAEAQLVALLGAAGGPGAGRAELVFPSDIVDAGYGIKVHRDIAEDVRALLQAAQLDGINLGGGGYRDSSAQIRLRRANCGSSDYAIYEMPASSCNPPTARPGSSMHEQGRAIDFTYNGALIKWRSGPGWEWLSANASSYGLFNLPSEAWHFSTNGK